MKTLNLRELKNSQVELLISLVNRAIYECEEAGTEKSEESRELLGYNPHVELILIKSWLTLNQ